MVNDKSTLRTLTVLMVLAACLTGCKSFDLGMPDLSMPTSLPWTGESEDSYQSPEKIIAVWSNTVYQQPGKSPTRGFGGRLYFYDKESKVIPVNGSLVVYAYDDSDQMMAGGNPTRKFAFTAEQLTKYYGESDLGASYNIWIPWDAVGGDEKEIALLPVFVDEAGRIVQGSFANNRLPGKRVMTDEQRRGFYVSKRNRNRFDQQKSTDQNVHPVNYQSPILGGAADQRSANSRMQTTTIDIPRSVSRQMAIRRRELTPPPVNWPAKPVTQPSDRDPNWREPGPDSSPTAAQPSAWSLDRPVTLGAPQGKISPTVRPQSDLSTAERPATSSVASMGHTGFIGVDPRDSVSARSRALARQDQRSARFEPPRFQVPVVPGARRGPSHGLTQRSQLAPPYDSGSLQ